MNDQQKLDQSELQLKFLKAEYKITVLLDSKYEEMDKKEIDRENLILQLRSNELELSDKVVDLQNQIEILQDELEFERNQNANKIEIPQLKITTNQIQHIDQIHQQFTEYLQSSMLDNNMLMQKILEQSQKIQDLEISNYNLRDQLQIIQSDYKLPQQSSFANNEQLEQLIAGLRRELNQKQQEIEILKKNSQASAQALSSPQSSTAKKQQALSTSEILEKSTYRVQQMPQFDQQQSTTLIMMNIEEILLLKRCFCDFFTKLLPTIKDPSILTRTRWHQFRNVLLDDHKSTTEIYNYVKELSFTESIKINTDTKINQSPKEQNQEHIRVQQTINQQLKTENREVFVKQSSKRKLSIKMKQDKQPDTANYQPIDQIQRVNYQTGKVDNFSTIQYKRQEKFQKDQILDQLHEEITIFKKHGQTLGTVYNKSFEINTSDLDQMTQQNINSFSANRQAQMDLIQLQNASRNATLKGYSIYAKKDKEIAKQRVDEYAQNYNNQKKVYM